MTPDQLAMNLAIAALTGEEARNYSTCLNAARKARRACGLGLPRNPERRKIFMEKLAAIIREDDPLGDAYDFTFSTPSQQCRALLRAFGKKETT